MSFQGLQDESKKASYCLDATVPVLALTQLYIALSNFTTNEYQIYSDLTLVAEATDLAEFTLQLTSDGEEEDKTAFTDGLNIAVRVDTSAGGEITDFVVNGFYGEPIHTMTIPANQVTLLSFGVTRMFNDEIHISLLSVSVVG